MLNEFLEFAAYTQDPCSDNPRLQPLLLTHSFSKDYHLDGIDKVLTIIARHFIFSEFGLGYQRVGAGNPPEMENSINCAGNSPEKENGINCAGNPPEKENDLTATVTATIQVMKSWIGMERNEKKMGEKETGEKELREAEMPQAEGWFREYKVERGWLEKYWKYHFQNYCSREKNSEKNSNPRSNKNGDRDADEEWKNCLQMRFENFQKDYDYASNTLTFRNIVADAMELGPLKERYCAVLKSEDGTDKKKESKRKDLNEINKKMKMFDYLMTCKHGQATTKLKVLKNIIAFLIWQQEYPDRQSEVILQKTRLFGWYGVDCSDGKAKHWYFDKYYFQNAEKREGSERSKNKNVSEKSEDVPIMFRVPFADYTKIGIHPDYLKKYDFRLISEKEIEKYSDKYWILKDIGHGLENAFEITNK